MGVQPLPQGYVLGPQGYVQNPNGVVGGQQQVYSAPYGAPAQVLAKGQAAVPAPAPAPQATQPSAPPAFSNAFNSFLAQVPYFLPPACPNVTCAHACLPGFFATEFVCERVQVNQQAGAQLQQKWEARQHAALAAKQAAAAAAAQEQRNTQLDLQKVLPVHVDTHLQKHA